MSTLDLYVYEGTAFASTGRLSYRTHQKLMNLYMYIPPSSSHHPSVFKAWIKSEGYRHVYNCSSFYDFWHMMCLFYSRLLARGYNKDFVARVFSEVFRQARAVFST